MLTVPHQADKRYKRLSALMGPVTLMVTVKGLPETGFADNLEKASKSIDTLTTTAMDLMEPQLLHNWFAH